MKTEITDFREKAKRIRLKKTIRIKPTKTTESTSNLTSTRLILHTHEPRESKIVHFKNEIAILISGI